MIDANRAAIAVRMHWGIENKLHYTRDVTLREDASRIRKNPGVFARIRSFAYNILRFNQSDTIPQDRYAAALGGLRRRIAAGSRRAFLNLENSKSTEPDLGAFLYVLRHGGDHVVEQGVHLALRQLMRLRELNADLFESDRRLGRRSTRRRRLDRFSLCGLAMAAVFFTTID